MIDHSPRATNAIDTHIGALIRLKRQLHGMSQEKLASAVGITFQQVQKYERGHNRVSASRLWAIAQILDVPITYFFEGLTDGDNTASDKADGKSQMIYQFINSSEGISLAKAMTSLENKAVRRQITELAQSLAKSHAQNGAN